MAGKSITVEVTLPEDMVEKIDVLAGLDYGSRSSTIRKLLGERLREMDQKSGPEK